MENIIIIGLISLNVIISLIGFQNPEFFNKYKFDMNTVINKKEYYRIISSSFLHADYMHLFFNMLTLYFFAQIIQLLGILGFLTIYFLAVIGGNLLTILIHKSNLQYTAVGASGGVTGIIFSAIAIMPNIELQFIILPFFTFYGWLFAILYLAYSIYGMQNNVGNVGHTAHLGGAIVGILGALLLFPKEVLLAKANMYITELPSLAVISIPIVFLFFIIFNIKR